MKVSVDELRRITLALLRHLEDIGQSEVEIAEDFYWNVPEELRYDTYEKPQELTIGQLTDDWAELQAILEGKREPVGRAVVWLAAILRRVGEKSRA